MTDDERFSLINQAQDDAEAAAKTVRENGKPVTGYDVFQWPEFKALFRRLGQNVQQPLMDIEIILPMDGTAVVKATVQSRDLGPGYVETTNLHNKTYRTGIPHPLGPSEPSGGEK